MDVNDHPIPPMNRFARVPPSGGSGGTDVEPRPPEGGTLAGFKGSKREDSFGGILSRNDEADSPLAPGWSRRGFLKSMGLLPAAWSAARLAGPASAAPPEPGTLPQIPFGKHSMSRLVCGANPFNAGSHLSVFVNHEMRQYYTPEQILKTLRRCQEAGINFWQSGGGDASLLHVLRL